VSPIMPFLTEHLWQVVVAGPCADAPDSIHLAGWPGSLGSSDNDLLESMEITREIVELGRRARGEAGGKLRQPLRSARVRGGDAARRHAGSIRDELRVGEVDFDADAVVEVSYTPDFPVLGPRIGPKVKEVAAALAAGDYEVRDDGSVFAAGEVLA